MTVTEFIATIFAVLVAHGITFALFMIWGWLSEWQASVERRRRKEWLRIPGNYCERNEGKFSPNQGRWLAGNELPGNKTVILSNGYCNTRDEAIDTAMANQRRRR